MLAVTSIALGGSALANPPTACAEPVWDIGAYDSCMARIPTILTQDEYEEAHRQCCLGSGGIYKRTYNSCSAPGVESQGRNPLPGDAPTHVIQPAPPPDHVIPAPDGVS